MKSSQILSFALITTLLFGSCSSDDEGNNNIPDNNPSEVLSGDYYPSNAANYWNYDVDNASSTNPELNFTSETDVITIASENGANFILSANNGLPAFGTMNAILVNNELSRTDDMLKISGTLDLPISGFEDFAIDFIDVILYDLNASDNQVLSNKTGNISNPFAGGTLTVAYALVTTNQGNLDSITVNEETFNNITRANLNLKIIVTLTVEGFTFPLTILPLQDVLNVDNYFAENIGLIKSEADIMYEMDANTITTLETAQIDLGFPTSLSVENVQELDSYSITE